MASSSSVGRHPVLTVLLVLLVGPVVAGGIMYMKTDHGKKLLPALGKVVLPALSKASFNISSITREKI